MKLLKASLLTSGTVITGMMVGFVSQKIYALTAGPEGLALIGNFNNVLSMAYVLAAGGIGGGIVKYTAQFRENPGRLKEVFQTVFIISIVCSLLVAIPFLLLPHFFSFQIFSVSEYNLVVVAMALMLPLVTFNQMALSVFSGLGKIKLHSYLSITLHGLNLGLTLLLAYFWGLQGILLSLFIPPAFAAFFSIPVLIRQVNIRWFPLKMDRQLMNSMFAYSLVTVFTLFVFPLVYLLLREHIIQTDGIEPAGHWQSVQNLSKAYTALAITLISIYFFPTISATGDAKLIRKKTRDFTLFLLAFLMPGLTFIYLLRDEILLLVFTEEFLPASDLFFYFLVGDLFKILAVILSYILLAKSKLRFYLLAEIGFAVLFYGVGILLIDKLGAMGATQAYALSYFAYFCVMFFFYKRGKAFGL